MMPLWSGSEDRKTQGWRVQELSFINVQTCHPKFYNYSEIDNVQNETNLEDIKVVLLILLCYIKFAGVLYSFFKNQIHQFHFSFLQRATF